MFQQGAFGANCGPYCPGGPFGPWQRRSAVERDRGGPRLRAGRAAFIPAGPTVCAVALAVAPGIRVAGPLCAVTEVQSQGACQTPDDRT